MQYCIFRFVAYMHHKIGNLFIKETINHKQFIHKYIVDSNLPPRSTDSSFGLLQKTPIRAPVEKLYKYLQILHYIIRMYN